MTKNQNLDITIDIYKLTDTNNCAQFKVYQNQFLCVLETAYKDRFIGREQTLNRIYQEKHVVFLALTKQSFYPFTIFDKKRGVDLTTDNKKLSHQLYRENETNIIGCSYLRPDGKRSGLAILPEYQGYGVARQLILTSLDVLPNQFVEIRANDTKMRNLLISCGFTLVTSEVILEQYLGANITNLCSVYYQNNELIYSRYSAMRPDIQHVFVMFEHLST